MKLLEDPRPVPDGTSAKVVISIWSHFGAISFKTSLKILCFILLIEFTFSNFEYFKKIPFVKGFVMFTYTYLSIAAATRNPFFFE